MREALTTPLLSRMLASASPQEGSLFFGGLEGLPEPSEPENYYRRGEFSSTSAEAVINLVSGSNLLEFAATGFRRRF